MKMEKLLSAVQTALEKMQRDGIKGWGLNELYFIYDDGTRETFGELIQAGAEHGCTSETCSHSSHDPAAATMKWLPPEGYHLSLLGEDGERQFFYITNDSEEYIVVRIEGGHYHDRLEWGNFEDVPEWMLAQLVEK